MNPWKLYRIIISGAKLDSNREEWVQNTLVLEVLSQDQKWSMEWVSAVLKPPRPGKDGISQGILYRVPKDPVLLKLQNIATGNTAEMGKS